MKVPGAYKITGRGRVLTSALDPRDPFSVGPRRMQRILDSLRNEIVMHGPDQTLSVRQVFETPREIFRLELQVPEMNYQRVTLLDRDALEELLEHDEVRALLSQSLN